VIELCHAIEADDLKEIDRLVAAGANVNAKGKDNMTPLMWAFPDNKLERFKRLLELGADPNVIFQSDLNTRGNLGRGESITHMACETRFPGYFEAVFAHGGDPNLIKNGIIKLRTPLFSVISGGGPNKKAQIQILIDKGADLNHLDNAGTTPVGMAVGWGGQYDIALMLLEAGANYKIYKPRTNARLVHYVLNQESRKTAWTPTQKIDYEKLVKWLEDHGESIDQARADIKRWDSYHTSTAEAYNRKMDAEIAERKRGKRRRRNSKKSNLRATLSFQSAPGLLAAGEALDVNYHCHKNEAVLCDVLVSVSYDAMVMAFNRVNDARDNALESSTLARAASNRRLRRNVANHRQHVSP
jgi:ankyrin repeat protein